MEKGKIINVNSFVKNNQKCEHYGSNNNGKLAEKSRRWFGDNSRERRFFLSELERLSEYPQFILIFLSTESLYLQFSLRWCPPFLCAKASQQQKLSFNPIMLPYSVKLAFHSALGDVSRAILFSFSHVAQIT